MNIKLEIPKITDLKPRISVIGIGGAGCNAINNMIATGLEGVEFVAANTDAQALAMSSAEHQIQLGAELTEGLGAGARPEIGRGAAEEAIEEIRSHIEGCHMVFLAAGMGGGTGTGAISVIARAAREMDILTVAIVSKPFQFEGSRRMRTAEEGIKELSEQVDTLIVIPNQNLFRIANQKTTFAEAFVLADQVLYSGIACIVDLIVKDGLINLDFADVKAVMKGMGSAMMGTGEATGEDRATLAAEKAIANPLLDEISLRGARGLLISIIGDQNLTLFEVDEAASRVKGEAHPDANIIVGASIEEEMDNKLRVSIVAAGLNEAGRYNANFGVGHHSANASMLQPAPNPHAQSPASEFAQYAAPNAQDGGSQSNSSEQSSGPDSQASTATATDNATARVKGEYQASAQEPHPPAAPPPLPSPVSGGQDPYLGDTPAEEFARALEDVIKSVADDGESAGDQPEQVWVSSDGIAIREGLTSLSPNDPPLVPYAQAQEAYQESAGFVAQQPADMPRRIPGASQLPPIAQQEFEAAREEITEQTEPKEEAGLGMPSLLRRLAGFGRQGTNLTDSPKNESADQSSSTSQQQLHSHGNAAPASGRRR